MSSSKKWASLISSIAFSVFFFLIILQIPLFRVPCRSGMCTTPVEVTCSQLIASELVPAFVVKALLYPGASLQAIMKGRTIPSFNKLPKLYSFNNRKYLTPATDLQRLEVLVGSYLCVAGALLGLTKARRMSFIGTLLMLWGLLREIILSKSGGPNTTKATHIYPTMLLALLSAFFSIKRDVRSIIRSCKPTRVAKSLGSKGKDQ